MIELIFVTCLGFGTDCRERVESLLPEVGLVGCMLGAQARIAEWQASHPGERIDRWSCGWAGSRGERA